VLAAAHLDHDLEPCSSVGGFMSRPCHARYDWSLARATTLAQDEQGFVVVLGPGGGDEQSQILVGQR